MKHNNKKTKKGFTLVELLAVIVLLAIILIIIGYSVLKNINDSKEKAKFMAAKDITSIAGAYIEENESVIRNGENETRGVRVSEMVLNRFLEQNVTNPKTGRNQNIVKVDQNGVESFPDEIDDNQYVIVYSSKEQTDYKIKTCSFNGGNYNCYWFNGYAYILEPIQ